MYPQQPPPYIPPTIAGPPEIGAEPAPRRRNRVLVTVGSVVTVGLVGLGAAAIAFGGGGASSPEEAVRHLATAIDEEDVLAAVATLAPDETRSLPELWTQSTAKGKELRLTDRVREAAGVDQDADDEDTDKETADDQNPFADLDIKVTGLQVEVKELADDIAKVEIVGGTISWDVPEGAELFDPLAGMTPWGFAGLDDYCASADYSDDLDGSSQDEMYDPCAEDFAANATDIEDEIRHGEIDLGELHRKADDDRPGVFAMTVQRDGGWYVSPLFTGAEYARVAAGGDPLETYDVDPGPAAGNPTDAVKALAAAVTTKDLDAAANVMASELSVWRVYSQAFDDDEFDSLDDAEINISDLELREEPIDDERVRVVIEHAVLEGSQMVPDYDAMSDEDYENEDYNGGGFYDEDVPEVKETWTLTIDGDCITTTSDSGRPQERVCLDEAADGIVKALGVNRIAFVAVTDRDGWAVSPIETIADYLRTVVDHLSTPLINRFLGSAGLDDTTAEPTMTLDEGDNEVTFDAAGMAVVQVDLDDGTLGTVTSDDEGVAIARDSDVSILAPGERSVVVTAPIGTKSATVTLAPLTVTELAATKADGTRADPVTGQVAAGELVAFRMTAADYRLMSLKSGYALTTEELDDQGEWIYVDSDTDPDETIVVVISGDPDDEFTEAGDDRYSITFAPATGGFSSDDPILLNVKIDDYSDDFFPLAVVAGQSFDLTAEATADVTVDLTCDSGQFDETSADDFPEGYDDEYDEDYGLGYGRSIDVVVGTPSVTRLAATETEICQVYLSPDYSSLDDDAEVDIDVTLRLTPVAG